MDGVPLLWLDSVDSTNTYVVTHFAELADGTLAAAGYQTAGRGRRGRAWIAPAMCNISASMAVKSPGRPFLAGAVVGLAGWKLAGELVPETSFFLKWPNDIYAGTRKLAGILCEGAGFQQGRLAGVAAGIGINVNLTEEQLAQLDQPAVSLAVLAGHSWPLMEVLDRFTVLLKEYYALYRDAPEELFRQWKAANRLIGCQLEFVSADGSLLRGTFEDIAPDGEMLLRTGGGRIRTLNCGDVRIRRESLPPGGTTLTIKP